MNTTDRLDPIGPRPIARHAERPVWRWSDRLGRWLRQLATPVHRPPHDELAELDDLDARTLADIGAPDRLLARAMAWREAQLQEREGLRAGLASGAWHHW